MRLPGRAARPPGRAPDDLGGLSEAELDAAISERQRFVARVREGRAKAVPPDERDATLKALGETTADLRRLDEERQRRPAPVPGVVTADRFMPEYGGETGMDKAQARAEHLEREHARQEAAWEKREREKREQAEQLRLANEARLEARRRRDADEGIGPPWPGAWAGFDAAGADLLAAVFADPLLWHEWLGRDPDRLDRNPPLHAADLLVLFSVLATLAARGTPEVVLPVSASRSWLPVGFGGAQSTATSAATSLRHLASNGWLVSRQQGSRLYVSAGPLAVAARDAYVARGRVPEGRRSS